MSYLSRRWTKWAAFLPVPAIAVAGLAFLGEKPTPLPSLIVPPMPAEATAEQVHQFCGSCHLYPPPETLPRSVWRREVKQAYDFFAKSPMLRSDFPSLESVALYYEKRAPHALPAIPRAASTSAPPAQF